MRCIKCKRPTNYRHVRTCVCSHCVASFPHYARERGRYNVYTLFYRRELVYIGVTMDLERRLLEHCKTKLFDRMVLHMGFDVREDAYKFERNFINSYRPFYNIKTDGPDGPLARQKSAEPLEIKNTTVGVLVVKVPVKRTVATDKTVRKTVGLKS